MLNNGNTPSTLDFTIDLFTTRRSGSPSSYGNPYDPNSLLTGSEIKAGFDYNNSRRRFDTFGHQEDAVAGRLTTEQILTLGPRVFNDPIPSGIDFHGIYLSE